MMLPLADPVGVENRAGDDASAADVRVPTRLRLFPVVVESSNDQFLVIRRDTGKMVHTSAIGADAIQWLRNGLTIAEVRREVGTKYQCDAADVDIQPLVDTLLASGFVAEVDGVPVPGTTTRLRDQLRGIVAAHLLLPCIGVILRYMPLGVTLRVVGRNRPAGDADLPRKIADNMRLALLLGRSADDIERLARENVAVLSQASTEQVLLNSLPPAKLHQWVTKRASVSGLEYLDAAVAGGRGVILCGFHVASYSLIPFMLAARGRGVTVLMAASDADAQIDRRVRELQGAGYTYPIAAINRRRGVRALVREVERGGAVLVLFDVAPQGHDGIEAPFLGRTLRVAKGTGWLSSRTGAPVLPLSIRSDPGGHYQLTIHPPLAAPPRDNTVEHNSGIVAALTAILERDVSARPESWIKWKDFDGLTSPLVTASFDVQGDARHLAEQTPPHLVPVPEAAVHGKERGHEH